MVDTDLETVVTIELGIRDQFVKVMAGTVAGFVVAKVVESVMDTFLKRRLNNLS